MTAELRQYIRTQIDLIVRARPQLVDFCDECGAVFEVANTVSTSKRVRCASCKPNARRKLQPALGT